jgi:hypothetical protein
MTDIMDFVHPQVFKNRVLENIIRHNKYKVTGD